MYELMERAGHAAYRQLLAEFPQSHRVLVLCGHGNNGGDGFVLARLAKEAGIHVQLVAVGNPDKYSGDTRQAQTKWLNCGGETHGWPVPLNDFDVIVDALLGTGIKGQVKSPYKEIISTINSQQKPVLSIDLPSGLHADTGVPCGEAVQASMTVTFVGIKAGLATGAGKQYCGKLAFSALGIAEVFNQLAQSSAVLASARRLPPLPKRNTDSHKGDYGRVLCIGGNQGMHGAVRLTAEAALRSGTGLVKVLCHPESRLLVAEALPELMLAEAGQDITPLFEWASCVVIGPGLGRDEWARNLFNALMEYQKEANKPMLIDADGLTLLADSSQRHLPENTVLTPHPGEAATLLRLSGADIQADRYQAMSRLVAEYHSTIILKGAGSLIGSGRHCFVVEDGNPGMASGGMGDLLSGIIIGLMAQGIDAASSALTGACIHAMAGDLCAEQDGQRGMIASDLIPYIRELVNR